MNYQRIYEYRFQDVNYQKKLRFWSVFSEWLWRNYLGKPSRILDPAAGMCEFINTVPAAERWAVDLEKEQLRKYADSAIRAMHGDAMKIKLPLNYFDAVFISNFLEHLDSQDDIATFLAKMYKHIRPGGKICVMGPNFRHAWKSYYDFADHKVSLTELGVAEHVYGVGFEIERVIPRLLPLSFRSNGFLPVNKLTVGGYLSLPLAWKIMGKQFLVVGVKK
jgi:SAM-dependent methyltransferase